jgi:UDP-N-acetylglucosamine 2-epimerase (non-hydrolysing)
MAGTGPRPYALVTLHRTSNVDDPTMLERLLDALADIATDLPVVFPAHPRTRARMSDHQLRFSGVLVTEPLTYRQFIGLEWHAKVIITDSGGIQEEASYLGVPCLTVMDTTARPVTVHSGTNHVVGRDPECLKLHVANVLAGRGKRGTVPRLWDGGAAQRVADHITEMAGVYR